MFYDKKIIRVYDYELDKMPKVRNLIINPRMKDDCTIGGYKLLFSLHKEHQEAVVEEALGFCSKKGLDFIENPNFDVQTILYNPTNEYEVEKPISLESSLFISQLLLYCTFIDSKHPSLNNSYDKIHPSIKKVIPVEKYYDYLDKGLIKIAIRIKKIIVGPGKYILVTEYIPVFTTAFNEIYDRLIKEYLSRYHFYPSKETLQMLKSKAIGLACDMKIDGTIIKNPYTFNALNGIEPFNKPLLYTNLSINDKVSKLLKSSHFEYIDNWDNFKQVMYQRNGLKWEDDLIDSQSKKKLNIWTPIENIYYDNRMDYTLEEQSKIFKKRR